MEGKSSKDESCERITGERILPPFLIPIVWTWKDHHQISTHPKSSIWGDAGDGCWIKYDSSSNEALEKVYREYASGQLEQRRYDLGTYTIDFLAMIQINRKTDFRRKVQRHVGFQPLIEAHYEGRQSEIYDASQSCELLNKIMTRIENEVKESIDRDIHFGVSYQNASRTVTYFRQKDVECFLDVINDCKRTITLCCERAGVSSEYDVLHPDSRSAVECCLGEDAREMCIHLIDFSNERLKRYNMIEEGKVSIAAETLLPWLSKWQTLNRKRLTALGVTRGDPSRPLIFHGWSEDFVLNELVVKTNLSLSSMSFRQALSFRPKTKAFLHTLNKYLESRKKMDARYLEVDEFQLIALHSISNDSGGGIVMSDYSSDDDSVHVKPEYQQQSSSGKPVKTMDELLEVATMAQPLFRSLINKLLSKLDAIMDGAHSSSKPVVSFVSLKNRWRASEKAQDDYSKFVPGPAFSWLYDIVRGSIEFHSAAEVIAFVGLLEQDQSIHIVKAKNRFQNPSLTGYRDLNIQFQIAVNDRFKHVCEIQIHHNAIKVLDRELNTHKFYEYFRSYFAGATNSLKDRLDDLRMIGGSGTVDEGYLHSLLPSCVDEERLERLAALFEVQLTEYHWVSRTYANLLDLRISKYGKRHPSIASAYTSIGNVMKAQGKLEEAVWYYKASLRSDQSSAMVVASTYRGMARILAVEKQTDDAMELFQSAVEILGEVPIVVGAYVDMANLLRDNNDCIRAMELYQRALEIAKNQYGEEHQHVATILQNMGRISSREGAYDAAIQLYQKSLEISKRTLGEDHLSAAEIYQSLGLIFQQQGDLDGAYSLYEKARHMYQAGLGAWHTLVADSYDMQAGVRWQECRFSDSRSLHDRARKIRSALQGRNSRSALRDGKNNFKFPSSSGVMVTNDLGFGISKNNVDEDHPYYAYGLDCVARSLMNSENPEEALLPIEKLIEVIKKTFGDQHVLLANVYQNMATVLRRLGMLDEAMESYEMFRCIVEQAREREIAVDRCSEWARAYEDIASLLLQRERTSRVADAFGALLAALKMRKRVALESNHEMLYIISTFESISKLLSENNKAMMIETMYENEPLARTRNRVVADGLELYQGMIRRSLRRDSRPAKMLLDAIAKVSEANENDDDQNSIHSKVCNLQNLLTERNYKELHSTVVELLDDLRKGH